MARSRGLRRKIDIEDGWKIGAGVPVVGRICREASEPASYQRKSDSGKIGSLYFFFNETGDRLRLYADDPAAVQTLVEITVDTRLFEAAIAEAKASPTKQEYREQNTHFQKLRAKAEGKP